MLRKSPTIDALPIRIALWLALLPLVCAAATPADWVPMRWAYTDPQALDLLKDTPVNCLLTEAWTPQLAHAAEARGVTLLALVTPASDVSAVAAMASADKLAGVVLEGDFPDGVAPRVREILGGHGAVIELASRQRLQLSSSAPVIGTYQGLWPGVQVQESGAVKAGPSGSAWIDTNSGFIRAVRAWGPTPLWISNRPPAKTVITAERYQQAIADAAIAGARWVITLDDDFAARLLAHEEAAVGGWRHLAGMLRFYEQHPEWRAMRAYGKLALVQDPSKGGLLSGGIIDMIAARHTPVRPIPRQRLSADSLAGANLAVNVDSDALTGEQKEILRAFTRSGGTLLTGPPGWKDQGAQGNSITLEKKELDRLNDIWHDVNAMVGRRNLGVRLFNVSSMLSNLLVSGDGKQVVVHLVNYSGYPVENVAMHLLGKFSRATLLTPGGAERSLELYQTEDGGGVDIDKVGVCATVRLE